MVLDIIFLIILFFAIIKGFQRGLILGIFSFLAIIIGLAAAMKLSVVAAHYIDNGVNVSAKWLPVISFIAVFIVVVLLVRWGARLLEKSVELAMMGWINRIGGIVLYMALFITVYSIFLFYATKAGLLKPETISASVTYPFIAPWGPAIIDGLGWAIPVFRDMFTGLEAFFDGIAQKVS